MQATVLTKYITCMCLSLWLASSTNVGASNLWEEKQWGDGLSSLIDPDEVRWLPTLPQQTFCLYRETKLIEIQGGVILLHPPGGHPDWPHTIGELRKNLVNHGWHTLSMQMPVSESNLQQPDFERFYEDSAPRFDEAIKFFKNINVENIIIVAQGVSGIIASEYLARKDEPQWSVSGLILISLPSYPKATNGLDGIKSIAQLPVAILDIYAENDAPLVIEHAALRRKAAREASWQPRQFNLQLDLTPKVLQLAYNHTGNLAYRQIKIEGAGPNFSSYSDKLVKVIRGWLARYAAGTVIR